MGAKGQRVHHSVDSWRKQQVFGLQRYAVEYRQSFLYIVANKDIEIVCWRFDSRAG